MSNEHKISSITSSLKPIALHHQPDSKEFLSETLDHAAKLLEIISKPYLRSAATKRHGEIGTLSSNAEANDVNDSLPMCIQVNNHIRVAFNGL